MASRAALRSVARRPPLIARSPAPIFSPSIRRWASSSSPSVKQRLRHPSQMGASDMFLVLSLLGGVAYVGTQFGRAGDERRARLAKSDAVEPEPQTPATINKKAAEAAETVPSPATPQVPIRDHASKAVPPEATTATVPEDEPEDASQAAFNPETGEINWDCPCLGGMAHGPCGEEFKAAFSCFVYSEEEPKGVECIEKFRGMQDCFRAHPDVYGEEAADDDEELDGAPPPSPSDDGKHDGYVLVEGGGKAEEEEGIEARAERALGRGR